MITGLQANFPALFRSECVKGRLRTSGLERCREPSRTRRYLFLPRPATGRTRTRCRCDSTEISRRRALKHRSTARFPTPHHKDRRRDGLRRRSACKRDRFLTSQIRRPFQRASTSLLQRHLRIVSGRAPPSRRHGPQAISATGCSTRARPYCQRLMIPAVRVKDGGKRLDSNVFGSHVLFQATQAVTA